MTRNKRRTGAALVAAPFLGWFAYGVHLYGWAVPLITLTVLGCIVTGVCLLVSSDTRS